MFFLNNCFFFVLFKRILSCSWRFFFSPTSPLPTFPYKLFPFLLSPFTSNLLISHKWPTTNLMTSGGARPMTKKANGTTSPTTVWPVPDSQQSTTKTSTGKQHRQRQRSPDHSRPHRPALDVEYYNDQKHLEESHVVEEVCSSHGIHRLPLREHSTTSIRGSERWPVPTTSATGGAQQVSGRLPPQISWISATESSGNTRPASGPTDFRNGRGRGTGQLSGMLWSWSSCASSITWRWATFVAGSRKTKHFPIEQENNILVGDFGFTFFFYPIMFGYQQSPSFP